MKPNPSGAGADPGVPHLERDALVYLHQRVREIIDENIAKQDEDEVYCRVCETDGFGLHAPECPILKLTQAIGTYMPATAARLAGSPEEEKHELPVRVEGARTTTGAVRSTVSGVGPLASDEQRLGGISGRLQGGDESELRSQAEVAPGDGRAMKEPDFWRCRQCGCVWRDNHDGSVSLGSAKQTSCPECEHKPTPEACEPLYRAEARDGRAARLQAVSDGLREVHNMLLTIANIGAGAPCAEEAVNTAIELATQAELRLSRLRDDLAEW